MGLQDWFPNSPLRRKAVSASPAVLETIQARQGMGFFPLIATPNTSDMVRAAYERAVSAEYGWMYRSQPAVRAVVDYIARNAAQLALRLYERTSDIERHEASDHRAADTMRNPNTFTPGQKLIFDLFVEHLVYGNAFAYKFRTPRTGSLSLTQLPAFRTAALGPSYFKIDAYRVWRTDGSHFDVETTDMLHWPAAKDPNDPRLGLSPLETLRRVLAEDAASQAASVGLMESGLVKPGYIARPQDAPEWSEDGRKRLQTSWANQGRNAAKETPVLDEGMTFHDFGITPKDAEMLSGRRFTIEEVCRVYGVPKGLMGASNSGTDSALVEEHAEFYADVLPPLCEMLCAYLDLSILQTEFHEDNYYFQFDLDEKLQGDERLTALTSASGGPVMTRNESRAKLNLPPKEGGDELIVPMNVTVGGKPSPQVMPVQDPNAPAQDGSARGNGTVPAGSTQSLNGHGKEKALLLKRREGQRRRRDRYASEATDVLRKFFASQERSMKDVKAFDVSRWVKELSAALLRWMSLTVEREGGIAAARMALPDFDMRQVENYLQAVADGFAEEINHDLQVALETGDPSEVFSEAKAVRAPGAGGTLATKMAAFAQEEAAKQTPDAERRTKTWLVTSEHSAHPEMNGETVGLFERFSNGKEGPPYEHPHCECLLESG